MFLATSPCFSVSLKTTKNLIAFVMFHVENRDSKKLGVLEWIPNKIWPYISYLSRLSSNSRIEVALHIATSVRQDLGSGLCCLVFCSGACVQHVSCMFERVNCLHQHARYRLVVTVVMIVCCVVSVFAGQYWILIMWRLNALIDRPVEILMKVPLSVFL